MFHREPPMNESFVSAIAGLVTLGSNQIAFTQESKAIERVEKDNRDIRRDNRDIRGDKADLKTDMSTLSPTASNISLIFSI